MIKVSARVGTHVAIATSEAAKQVYRIVATLKTGTSPFVVSAAFGDMWVPSVGGAGVWRYRVS